MRGRNQRVLKMSDFERYGDYNEVDEAPTKSKIGIALKVLIYILCFGVVIFLVFRVFTFNYYPEGIKSIYFTDELTELYNKNGGEIGALTQKLLDSRSFGFDDSGDGNFYCKYMIYIPETEELQLTLRYNVSLMDAIKDEYNVELSPDGENNFNFSLVAARTSDIADDKSPNTIKYGTPIDASVVAQEYDSFMMYRYIKLVFDGVSLDTDTPDEVNWLRLDIKINGVEMEEPYTILVYWNTEDFPLIPYVLSKKEVP